MWMVSYVVDIALSVTHLGKVITGHFYLVLGILNFAFKYGPDRIEQKQLRDTVYRAVMELQQEKDYFRLFSTDFRPFSTVFCPARLIV